MEKPQPQNEEQIKVYSRGPLVVILPPVDFCINIKYEAHLSQLANWKVK